MAVKMWPHMHLVPTVQAQGNIRTVIVDPPHMNDPIEIVKVVITGKESVRGAPSADDLRLWPGGASPFELSRVSYKLPSGENWLSNLYFVLRNRTSEKIARVEIILQLPETGWKGHPQFSYGQFPAAAAYFADGTAIPQKNAPISFDPCGEMTFALADDQVGLEQLREQPLQLISQVYARLRVYLEDGLAWMAYSYEKPDSEHRGQWVLAPSPYFPRNGLPGPSLRKPAHGQPPFSCSESPARGGDSLP